MSNTMEQFSLEYLYSECNIKKHCLGAELKEPLIIDGKLYEELYILKIHLTEKEEELLITNMAHGIDTNSTIVKVLAFVNGQNPYEACEYSIDTDNIKIINSIQ